MAITAARVTVKAEATALNESGPGLTIYVTNLGETPIDLGPEGVESGKGYELAKEASEKIEINPGDVLYGIAEAEKEVEVAVLRT